LNQNTLEVFFNNQLIALTYVNKLNIHTYAELTKQS